jgi:hypothetical protein
MAACHRAMNCWHKPARPWVPPERRVQRQLVLPLEPAQAALLRVVRQRGLLAQQQVQPEQALRRAQRPRAQPVQQLLAQQQPVLSGPPWQSLALAWALRLALPLLEVVANQRPHLHLHLHLHPRPRPRPRPHPRPRPRPSTQRPFSQHPPPPLQPLKTW